MDNDNFDQTLQHTKQIIDECKIIINRHLTFREQALVRQYGDDIHHYLNSLPQTLRAVNDVRVEVRVRALAVLKEYWGVEGIRQVPETVLNSLAMRGHTPEEQRLALYCLRTLHRQSHQLSILGFFSCIVLRERMDASVRGVAYEGLLEVSGVSPHLWPSFMTEEWEFPEYVDWGYVSHCSLLESGPPSVDPDD